MKWHTIFSYIKSAFRIAGCLLALTLLSYPGLAIATISILFILAEIAGIAEEFKE